MKNFLITQIPLMNLVKELFTETRFSDSFCHVDLTTLVIQSLELSSYVTKKFNTLNKTFVTLTIFQLLQKPQSITRTIQYILIAHFYTKQPILYTSIFSLKPINNQMVAVLMASTLFYLFWQPLFNKNVIYYCVIFITKLSL